MVPSMHVYTRAKHESVCHRRHGVIRCVCVLMRACVSKNLPHQQDLERSDAVCAFNAYFAERMGQMGRMSLSERRRAVSCDRGAEAVVEVTGTRRGGCDDGDGGCPSTKHSG